MIPKKYLPDDPMRKKIVQGSPELRQLAAQLEQAYINKERPAQVAERKLQRQEDEREQQIENDRLEQQRINNIKLENEEIRDGNIRRLRYQKELDEQLQLIQAERNKIFQQFLAEKSMIDAVIAKLQRENQQNMIRKMEEKRENQNKIQMFVDSQRIWRERESEKAAIEEANIKRFIEAKDARDQMNLEREKSQRLIKNENVLKLAEKIAEQDREKLERERILLELQQIRQEEEQRRKDELELELEFKKKLNLRDANMLATQFRNDRLQKERDDEERWKQKMMEKFAEDDKIEQMNAQKRRMKREEHRRAVLELLELRKQNRAAEKEEEHNMRMNLDREQEKHQQILEEERKRILSAHLETLKDYIPKGVISQNELHQLSEQLNL
eukprot:TRINITY_DN12547_c0_g1_i3.p1 TRINITY_DN12547_c0_g1~~TRINITY_DN12547_c0_g1_i3.p1  ORF type:complete len:385 (-),score=106.21 TRINITY_DN12547_c0_g1_i3:21-1175(-)